MVIITIWCHLDRCRRESFVPLFSLSLSFRLPSLWFVFDNANINNRTPHAYLYNIAAVMVIITIWCHLDRGGRETFVPLFSLSLSIRLPSLWFVFDNANINNRTPHAYLYNIAAVMVIITIWCHLDRGGRETFVHLFSLSLSFRLPSLWFVFDNANINNITPHVFL